MKKLFSSILVLGLMLSGYAYGNSYERPNSKWTFIEETNSGVWYADPESYRKDEAYHYLDILKNLKEPLIYEEGNINSIIYERKFNCKYLTYYDQKFYGFKKVMAKDILTNQSTTKSEIKWIRPDMSPKNNSISKKIIKNVCQNYIK